MKCQSYSQEWHDTPLGLRPVLAYLNFRLEPEELGIDKTPRLQLNPLETSLQLHGYSRLSWPHREPVRYMLPIWDTAGQALANA